MLTGNSGTEGASPALTDEQRELETVAGRLARHGLAELRGWLRGEPKGEEPTRTLLADYGALGLVEQHGGVGGTLLDIAVMAERLGRTLTMTPWFSHIMAIHTAARAGLPVTSAATGAERWTLVTRRERIDRLAESDVIPVVDDGAWATHVVVCDGARVALLPVRPLANQEAEAFDLSRPVADVVVTGAVDSAPAPPDVLVPAYVTTAAELVGVARGAIALGSAYARTRHQFGAAIGRFQAVAHQLATAWLAAERAWSLTLLATAADGDTPWPARAAFARAAECAVFAAERALQVHGGLGMTWEADPHLFLRRALARAAGFGTVDEHYRGVGAAVLGVDAGPSDETNFVYQTYGS